jgi:uncharacterized repeat protein (TIGR03803 family)
LSITMSILLTAQTYVHPNQAGRKGTETGGGIGYQIVTSSYYGNYSGSGQGTIISMNKDGANAAVYHEFKGQPTDGSYPWYTTPHGASDGNIYGATYVGGSSNNGAIYKFDLGPCSESVIYNTPNGTGGGNRSNVNELSDGRLYFCQSYGGTNGHGTLISMNKDGSDVKVLHTFNSNNLVKYTDSARNKPYDDNLSSRISSSNLNDGRYPYGFVVEGNDGFIYGTTAEGGAFGTGTLWRCNLDGTNYRIILACDWHYRYNYYTDGSGVVKISSRMPNRPYGNVAIAKSGRIFFTGFYGCETDQGGMGSIDPDGGNYRRMFSADDQKGLNPFRGPLIIGDEVFGTSYENGYQQESGGDWDADGVVWKMNTNGTGYKIIKTFISSVGDEGYNPYAGLAYDGQYLYGTCTFGGGSGKAGTIWRLRTTGASFEVLYRFSSTSASPCAGKPGGFMYYPSQERITFANTNLECSKSCIPVIKCNAGTAAPSITPATITNTCGDTMINLNNLVATNLPAATEVSYHTGTPATLKNQIKNASNVPAGTYYACIWDKQNGCFGNKGTATTVITATKSVCCPAGYAAPELVNINLKNICPSDTIKVNQLNAFNFPGSPNTYTFHSGFKPTTANKVASGMVTTGVYYVSFYSASGNCYSPTTKVNTTVKSCCEVNEGPDLKNQ